MMTKRIKKHWDIALVFGIGLVLAISISVGMGALRPGTNDALAAATTVTVTATVQEWLTFTGSATSVALSPDLVSTAGVEAIGSSTVVDLNLGTNASTGWSVTIAGANAGTYGSLISSANYIYMPSASSTLVVGTDGYGVNATNSYATTSIVDNYSGWGSTKVGRVPSGAVSFATCSNCRHTSTNVIDIKVYAAADNLQPNGSYTDTITLTATGGI